jgi:HD-like signal output (HDOD) protein
MLAEEVHLPLPDEAFVAGLLHDIGLVVMLQSNLPAMQELMRLTENFHDGESTDSPAEELFRRAEQHLFGASHEAFGTGLSHQWRFPRSFQYVTGFHHRPDELASDNRLLTQVIHVADRLSCQLQIGMVLPVDSGPIAADIQDAVGLTDENLASVRERLAEQVDQAMALLD